MTAGETDDEDGDEVEETLSTPQASTSTSNTPAGVPLHVRVLTSLSNMTRSYLMPSLQRTCAKCSTTLPPTLFSKYCRECKKRIKLKKKTTELKRRLKLVNNPRFSRPAQRQTSDTSGELEHAT